MYNFLQLVKLTFFLHYFRHFEQRLKDKLKVNADGTLASNLELERLLATVKNKRDFIELNMVVSEDEIYIATVRLTQQDSRLRGKLFDLNAVQQETHADDGASILALRVAKVELDKLLSREGMSAADFFAQYTHR